MRKALSILITLFICVSLCLPITSCAHEHTWDEGSVIILPSKASDGVKRFTCSGCGTTRDETYEYMPTITKEQWDAAWELDNYTLSLTLDGEDGGKIKTSNGSSFMDMVFAKTYITEKNGTFYYIIATDTGNVGSQIPEMDLTLSGMISDGEYDDKFSTLTFDEDIGAYIYISEDEMLKSYFYFDNGELRKIYTIEADSVLDLDLTTPIDEESRAITEMVIYDIGKTTVNVPEFEEMN